jgi:hypothetical protein
MTKKSWLELAVSDDDTNPKLNKVHGCIAADGFRAHIEHANGPCDCGNDKLHKNLDGLLEMVKDTPFSFVVNRKFLLDALSGINPDGTAVIFYVKPGGTHPIIIQDPDEEQTAIIMPMYVAGVEAEPMKPLPRVAPEAKKKSSKRKSTTKVQS